MVKDIKQEVMPEGFPGSNGGKKRRFRRGVWNEKVDIPLCSDRLCSKGDQTGYPLARIFRPSVALDRATINEHDVRRKIAEAVGWVLTCGSFFSAASSSCGQR